MNKFIITTDTTADLPADYVAEHNLGMLSLTYTIDGKTYDWEHPMDVKEFYAKMRAGSLPTTSQVNPETAREIFTKIAASEMEEDNFPHKVVVVDSLCASMGEGLLVHKAVQMKENGASLEETVTWLEENKLHLVHNFTVDDLFHLHRGGRVSKTAAVLGTMINLKPVLHVDDEGHLIMVSKVRGRKKSLITLVDNMEKQMGSYRDQNDIVFISHGDSLEDAQFVANLVKERFGIDSFLINYVGSTIGAHSGPGTIALFYMGEYR